MTFFDRTLAVKKFGKKAAKDWEKNFGEC